MILEVALYSIAVLCAEHSCEGSGVRMGG
ncbi:unnamed protein product [Chondrus crispus]|uniref:Uncharacterized protein n=1 Tax=Chondrus crispus TaxID=2769 RepID=R7QII4_CHOCR|nr:unnamed protein product [Chondrus crispus]CDF37884.1 unnamed protein product [Chondrus crispus]|eukprot:XP_005717755.1 unnamed protein product [Chondrus crispus]